VFDVYESDLIWIKKGQKVEFTVNSYPGRIFDGQIVFVSPTVNSVSRTVRVRANIVNKNGILKPKMFVKGLIYSKLDSNGLTVDNQAESSLPLVVPLSAPLITGKRAVVYVENKDKKGVFAGRQVVLGPRTDDGYVVLSGLREGEKVVVKGNFKIDSELQIMAKPSMMYSEGSTSTAYIHGNMKKAKNNNIASNLVVSEDFRKSASIVIENYFKLQNALSHDNLADTRKFANKIVKDLKKVKMYLLDAKAHMVWMESDKKINESAVLIEDSKNLDSARKHFEALSEAVYQVVKDFKPIGDRVYRYYCPMAFNNKGAYWLQDKQGTENPYFGSKMFTCGSEVEQLGKTRGIKNERE
jgi:Cu(I)/Ag(I) efflux system membrane fusion protein